MSIGWGWQRPLFLSDIHPQRCCSLVPLSLEQRGIQISCAIWALRCSVRGRDSQWHTANEHSPSGHGRRETQQYLRTTGQCKCHSDSITMHPQASLPRRLHFMQTVGGLWPAVSSSPHVFLTEDCRCIMDDEISFGFCSAGRKQPELFTYGKQSLVWTWRRLQQIKLYFFDSSLIYLTYFQVISCFVQSADLFLLHNDDKQLLVIKIIIKCWRLIFCQI